MFGDKLKILREEKEITQKELGNIIGVSDRVIGYYESNDRFPKEESVLRKISEYFDVSTDYLLGKTDKRNYDYEIKTIAAHKENDEPWTEEELDEIEKFKEFVRMKRSQNK